MSYSSFGSDPTPCVPPAVPVAGKDGGATCSCPASVRNAKDHLGEGTDRCSVPRTCADFDRSAPCDRDYWFYRPHERCVSAPSVPSAPLPPDAGAYERERRERREAVRAHYLGENCDGWTLGTKLVAGSAVLFGAALIGGLLGK